MEANVQIAIIGGCFTIGGYFIGAVQKTFERYLGQKHFQKTAVVILRELRKEMEEVKEDITNLSRGQESQRAIMKQLLSYSKQQVEAANKMSKIVENFIYKSGDKLSDNGDDSDE